MASLRTIGRSIDPRRSSGIALAVLGAIGIVIIIYLQKEVDLPVKIALALAAAGISGALPGSLIFKNKYVSAGGAIGVFCLVMFYDVGQTWIQPIAKPTQQLSSVTMSKKQMLFQNGIASAQFEIMREDYGNAVDLIRQVLKLREDDRLALRMLGYSYFRMKNYHEAARVYEKAFNADPTGTDAASAHNVATSYEVGGDYDKALEWIEKAYSIVNKDDNPTLWRSVVYDRGLFNLTAWIERGRGSIDGHYNKVRSSFKEFLEIGGKSPFTNYNLCCLYTTAVSGAHGKDEAKDHLNRFFKEVREETTSTNKIVFDRLLGIKSVSRGPGEPPSCPAISKEFQELWEKLKEAAKSQVGEDIMSNELKKS